MYMYVYIHINIYTYPLSGTLESLGFGKWILAVKPRIVSPPHHGVLGGQVGIDLLPDVGQDNCLQRVRQSPKMAKLQGLIGMTV